MVHASLGLASLAWMDSVTVSPAAVVEQISISEEEEAAARSQQLREDEALARRLQVEDDSDIGTCRRYTHTHMNIGTLLSLLL